MFKIIKKSEYEDLYLKFNNEANENRKLQEEITELKEEVKELRLVLENNLSYKEIIEKGTLCYEVYEESKKVYFYKFLNGERVSFHGMNANLKTSIKFIEEKNIKSYEELSLDYLFNLGVD